MELEELRHHWATYRATTEDELLSEEALSELLPYEPTLSYRRILSTATRYAAVYGFLLFFCQSC